MIKVSFIAFLLCSSLSLIGQTKTTQLPSFYNQKEGDPQISADLIFNEAPTVLYVDQPSSQVTCKQWDGNKWNEFGTFPKDVNADMVRLSSFEDMFYALIREGKGWTLLSKERASSEWTVVGGKHFVPMSTFSKPILNYNEGNLMIYDKSWTTGKLVLYSLQEGKMIKVTSKLDMKLDDEFHYTCTDKGESVMGWKIESSGKKYVLKVGEKKGKTKSYKIMKGLPKPKKLWGIQHLAFSHGKLYLAYYNYAFTLRVAIFNEEEQRWVTIYPPETPTEYKASFSKEMSFVTINRETKNPVLFKCTGDNWLHGMTLDVGKVDKDLSIKLIENKEILYLMTFDEMKVCQIHEISITKN